MNEILPDTSGPTESDIPDIRHGFSVGQLHLLIPLDIPAELFDEINLSLIPLTPLWFKGMTNHRGEVVPVFSLPELFSAHSQQPAAKSQNWLLILGKTPRISGLLIDIYPQLLKDLQEIDLDSVSDIPGLIKPYITRAYHANGKDWLEFQYDAWLLSLKAQFQHYLSLP